MRAGLFNFRLMGDRSMRKMILSLALVLLSGTAAAAGQAAYTPEDIIKFFNDQTASRGICVGTDEECGAAKEKKVTGFDLRVTFEYNSDRLTDDAKANL